MRALSWHFSRKVRVLFLLCHVSVVVVAYQQASASQIKKWTQQLQTGYQRRIAADPQFASKSITEVLVAAGTQLTAEWNRRGADRLLPELDFVVPAILTAVFGKYYRYECIVSLHSNQSLVKFLVCPSMAYTKPIPLEQEAGLAFMGSTYDGASRGLSTESPGCGPCIILMSALGSLSIFFQSLSDASIFVPSCV